jgi:hypothetical protein
MKSLIIYLILLTLVFSITGLSLADNSAQVTLTYQVEAINEISLTGIPSLILNSINANITAGDTGPYSVSDTSTTYGIATNGENKKITGLIDTSAMPDDVTLSILLTAPTGGTTIASAIAQDFTNTTTVAKDLVQFISNVSKSDLLITYTLSATLDAEPMANSDSLVITYTLTDGSAP